MKYWFDTDDAQRWGLPAAAVLSHISYWIERNDHETGRPCVTQTVEQMQHYLPFLSQKQIRGALKKLEGEALTKERNGFNPVYTYCLIDQRENRVTKGATAVTQKVQHVLPKRETVHILNNKTEEKANAREVEYERPTEEEVVEYFSDIGGQDVAAQLGQEFHTHYESTGWIVSGTPMAKWKPKARTWLSRYRNKQSNERRKGFNPSGFTPDGLKDFIVNG
jgi:hypothetical protein